MRAHCRARSRESPRCALCVWQSCDRGVACVSFCATGRLRTVASQLDGCSAHPLGGDTCTSPRRAACPLGSRVWVPSLCSRRTRESRLTTHGTSGDELCHLVTCTRLLTDWLVSAARTESILSRMLRTLCQDHSRSNRSSFHSCLPVTIEKFFDDGRTSRSIKLPLSHRSPSGTDQ